MIIKKSNDEISDNIDVFLDYETSIGKIKEEKSDRIRDVLSREDIDMSNKEQIRSNLLGILESDEFEQLYGEYNDFYKSSFKKIREFIVKHNIFPDNGKFLVNDFIKENFEKVLGFMEEFDNMNEEEKEEFYDGNNKFKNSIKENIDYLKGVVGEKLLKNFKKLILSCELSEIKNNIEALRESGIGNPNDLEKIQEVIIGGGPKEIKDNIEALKKSGIEKFEDIEKLQKVIIKGHSENILKCIKELRDNLGINDIDDICKLTNILTYYDCFDKENKITENIEALRSLGINDVDVIGNILYNLVNKGESKNITENIKALRNLGIENIDDFKKLDHLIIHGESSKITENIKALRGLGIGNIDDFKILESIIRFGEAEKIIDVILLLRDMGIVKINNIAGFSTIIINGDIQRLKKITNIFKKLGIFSTDNLCTLNYIVNSGDIDKIEKNIKFFKECGIDDIGDFHKLENTIGNGKIQNLIAFKDICKNVVDYKNLENIIIKGKIENINAVKHVCKDVNDYKNLENIIIKGKIENINAVKHVCKDVNGFENLEVVIIYGKVENVKILGGICTSPDDFNNLKEIFCNSYDYSINNIRAFLDAGIKKPSDFKDLKEIICYYYPDVEEKIRAFSYAGIKKAVDFLNLKEFILDNYCNTNNVRALGDIGINNVAGLKSLKGIICERRDCSENIKLVGELGINKPEFLKDLISPILYSDKMGEYVKKIKYAQITSLSDIVKIIKYLYSNNDKSIFDAITEISTENLGKMNELNEIYNEVTKTYITGIDSIILLLNSRGFTIDEIKNFNYHKWYNGFEILEFYFDKFGNNVNNVVLQLLPVSSINKLSIIFNKYDIDLQTLLNSEDLKHILSEGVLENLEIILNKYDDITLKQLLQLKDIITVPNNVRGILDRCKIDLQTLLNSEDLKHILSKGVLENLEIILNKYKGKNINELCIYPELFCTADPKNLEIVFNHYDIDYNKLENLENVFFEVSSYVLEEILLHYEETKKHLDYLELESIAKAFRGVDVNPKNLKIIFNLYKNISINDFYNTKGLVYLLENANYKNLESVIKNFQVKLNKIIDYNQLFCCKFSLPEKFNFKEKDHKGYIKFLNEIIDTNYDSDEKSSMIEFLVTLTFEEAKHYLKTFQKLDNSISPDIQLVKNELINEILKSKDPLNLADTIVGIFEKNNIPLTGQIFKVFELLYPQSRIQELFKKYPYSSPKLKSLLEKGEDVYKLIYKDLMNISIKSGDRTLRDYLMVFVGSEKLLRKFEDIVSSDGFNGNDENCLADRLEEGEQEKLLYLFRKISVLCSRYLGKQLIEQDKIEHGNYGKYTITDNKLVSLYYEIKKGFNLRDGKSIYDRLQSLLYVNGLKYHSAEEVLDEMNKSKRHAHERGLKLYNEATGGKIKFPDEAFVKGVSDLSFKKIIGTGIRSREYLGSGYDLRSTGVCGSGRGNSATSDTTPFDIDGFCSDHFVHGNNWTGGIAGEDDHISVGYGYVNFVVDIVKTDENGNPKFYDNTPNKSNQNKSRRSTIRKKEFHDDIQYNTKQYELFQTETSEGIEHCGIRTGIPMTEVDYIIYTGNFESKEYQDMCYEIARNGYYIPVADRDGMIKFTPEMYHRIRAGFNFMQYYDGFDVVQDGGKWVSAESDNKVRKEYTGTNKKIIEELNEEGDKLKDLIAANSPNNETYKKFAEGNRKLANETIDVIIKALEDNFKITFKSQFDTSITGAEIYDSGSTGRGTDIPTKDVDLDFTLILDEKDYEKIDEIKRVIHEKIGTQKKKDHDVTELSKKKNERVELGNQLKSEINNIGKSDERPNGVPLDLLILKKSQVIHYSSSDAMKEKLNFIEKNLGKEDYNWVRTNIIIMKKLLKAKGCYKHPEGGIAGIGVENWITENHGSFIEALESFEQVAYQGEYEPGKQPIPLEEFKKRYPMFDAGENYKDGKNDNFVYKIDKDKESRNTHCYESILEIIIALRTKGIGGIEELIKKYENDKSEYIG